MSAIRHESGLERRVSADESSCCTEYLAGHLGRQITHQVGVQRGHVIRRCRIERGVTGELVEQSALEETPDVRFVAGTGRQSGSPTGTDDVDPNAVRLQVSGHRQCQTVDAALGRRISGATEVAGRGRRARGHDRPVTLPGQDRRGHPSQLERAQQVGVELRAEVGSRHGEDRRLFGFGDPGAVDHRIQAAEPVDRCRDQCFGDALVGRRTGNCHSDTAAVPHIGGSAGRHVTVASVDHHRCTLGDKAVGHGATDSPARTGDHHALAGEMLFGHGGQAPVLTGVIDSGIPRSANSKVDPPLNRAIATSPSSLMASACAISTTTSPPSR